MDALQQVRKQLKTQCINKENTITASNDREQEKIWTDIELLERSRYILFKMAPDWEEDETAIMDNLFTKYPVLQSTYELTQKLRLWYNVRNIGKHTNLLEKELYNWCDEVNQSKIQAFRAVRKMIEKHLAMKALCHFVVHHKVSFSTANCAAIWLASFLL